MQYGILGIRERVPKEGQRKNKLGRCPELAGSVVPLTREQRGLLVWQAGVSLQYWVSRK